MKVYGPHVAVLYTRRSSLTTSLSSLAHHFLKIDSNAYKICPGGTGYELTYAVSGVLPYLRSLSPSSDIDDAFSRIASHEQALLHPLLGYLTSESARARGIRIVGNEQINLQRVPTVSFVVVGDRPVRSKDIVGYFDKKGNVRNLFSFCLDGLLMIIIYGRWEYAMDISMRTRSSTTFDRKSILMMPLCGFRWCITIRSTRSKL